MPGPDVSLVVHPLAVRVSEHAVSQHVGGFTRASLGPFFVLPLRPLGSASSAWPAAAPEGLGCRTRVLKMRGLDVAHSVRPIGVEMQKKSVRVDARRRIINLRVAGQRQDLSR